LPSRQKLDLTEGNGENEAVNPNRLKVRMNEHELSTHVQQKWPVAAFRWPPSNRCSPPPGQKVPEHGDVVCYQSKMEINQKMYLVRVMVNEKLRPPKVVTFIERARSASTGSQQYESNLRPASGCVADHFPGCAH